MEYPLDLIKLLRLPEKFSSMAFRDSVFMNFPGFTILAKTKPMVTAKMVVNKYRASSLLTSFESVAISFKSERLAIKETTINGTAIIFKKLIKTVPNIFFSQLPNHWCLWILLSNHLEGPTKFV